ncbi:MAG: hypothetical protein EAZ57_02290 [Cytophagales bacterium]|nr:MAG: hypothetical protein EAZ67_02295 [Cytophagales bacterium]TAF61947.1 MAG: hypothetical protein EAZ57_02290 [Cytophagales bacterium]
MRKFITFKSLWAMSVLLSGMILFTACGEEKIPDTDSPNPTPNAPRVKKLSPVQDTITVKVGAQVEFFAEVAASELDFKIWRVDGKNVTVNPSTDPNKYKHTFDKEGTTLISIFATNRGGSNETTWVVKVAGDPIPRSQLLTNDSSKVWKYKSIKINNEGTELLKSYEADNTIKFFKTRQVARPPFITEYNYIHDVGTNVKINDAGGKETSSYGLWKLSSSDVILEIDPLYTSNLTIRELTATKLVFSIRLTSSSTIFYTLEATK